jgi:tetratricopeptide (TPR) repeat protein
MSPVVRHRLTCSLRLLAGRRGLACAGVWLTALGALVGLSGCRWCRREGPVPQSVLNCRQLSQEGVTALERGQTQEAETLLAKAITTCPTDCEARRNYADLLHKTGRRQEAVLQLTEALKSTPEDEASWVKLADLYLSLDELDRAQQTATQALQLNPRSVSALTVQARVKRKRNESREALSDFHRALNLDPENRELLWEIADTYRQIGEPQRELANLQALADTFTPGEEPQRVLHHQGLALSSLGRHAEAVSALTLAKERAPASPELLFHLAEAELRVGHTLEARQALAQALTMEPNHTSSRTLLDRLEIAQQPGAFRR